MADNSILDYSAQVTQRVIGVGSTPLSFYNIQGDNSYSLGVGDTDDYYKLTVSRSSNIVIRLRPQSSAADLSVSLIDYTGNPNNTVVSSTNNPNGLAEAIITDPAAPLEAGKTYYIRVSATNLTTDVNYVLEVDPAPTTRNDILWRDTAPISQGGGGISVWQMNGTQVTNAQGQYSVDPSFQLMALGDLDGDGNADYFWGDGQGNNSVWLMNADGINVKSVTSLPTFGGANWNVGGMADFDGDGDLDVLWQYIPDGSAGVWIMDGTTYLSVVDIDTVKDPGWIIRAVADFDGDGKTDVLYRNFDTGENVVWLMDGTKFKEQITLPSKSKEEKWTVEGAADFNGDGALDLFWRNYTTGDNEIWFLNGTTLLSSAAFYNVPISYEVGGFFNTPPVLDLAGNSTSAAFNIGRLDATATYTDTIGRSDTNDYYAFTLDVASKVSVTVNGAGLGNSSTLQIVDANGAQLGPSTANGNDERKITDLNLDKGTYYVRLNSTSATNTNYSINIGATGQSVNLTFPTTPPVLTLKKQDNTVIDSNTTVSVKDPYSFKLDYNVTYTGATQDTFKVAFFLSTDATITTDDYRFDLNGDGQRNTSDFATITNTQPDTIINRIQNLTLPSKDDPFWVQDGTYYIGVILDPEGEILELDPQGNAKEDDNTYSTSIKVRDARLPDLTPIGFDITQSSIQTGGTINLTGAVKNIGTAASDTQKPPGSQFRVYFYLSTDNTLNTGAIGNTPADFLLGAFVSFTPLAAGAEASLASPLTRNLPGALNWTGYSVLGDANYYVLMVVDRDQTVNEITGGTSNNVAFDQIFIDT